MYLNANTRWFPQISLNWKRLFVICRAMPQCVAPGDKSVRTSEDISNGVESTLRYGSVISISAHLPSAIRKKLYPLVERCLKPGGIIFLEAYPENQLPRNTGGPKDPDMLMTRAKIESEFPNFEPVLLRQLEREVCEGTYHTGKASVVQFIGRKRA